MGLHQRAGGQRDAVEAVLAEIGQILDRALEGIGQIAAAMADAQFLGAQRQRDLLARIQAGKERRRVVFLG